MRRLREGNGWSQTELADRLGVSKSHVSALEGGEYRFHASMIEKLATVFNRPLTTFLHQKYSPEALLTKWQCLFDELPLRERSALVTLGEKLSAWGAPSQPDRVHKSKRMRGHLVSIEGIDGEHLHQLGTKLLAKAGTSKMAYCPYDYRGHLWKYMIPHFSKLDKTRVIYRAIERNLLFACERLLRYENQVAPALSLGKAAIVPFFLMAPSVYQRVEGVSDRRIIHILETLLPKPDIIVFLRSNPSVAAKKAVKRIPKVGEFYSPYSRPQLQRALRIYEQTVKEYEESGMQTYVFNTFDGVVDGVVEQVYRLAVDLGQKAKA